MRSWNATITTAAVGLALADALPGMVSWRYPRESSLSG